MPTCFWFLLTPKMERSQSEMINRVLVAVDGSENSMRAVELAAEVTTKFEAEMSIIHVVSKIKIPEELEKFAKVEKIEESPEYLMLDEIGHKILDKAESVAKQKGIRKIRKIIRQGDPANEIIKFAKENQIDSVFLGSRGLSEIKSLLFGSVSNKVCNLASTNCVTVR